MTFHHQDYDAHSQLSSTEGASKRYRQHYKPQPLYPVVRFRDTLPGVLLAIALGIGLGLFLFFRLSR